MAGPKPKSNPNPKKGIETNEKVDDTGGRGGPPAKMCCACRTRKPVDYLVRVSRHRADGSEPGFTWSVGAKNGRGAHVCLTCIEKCVKTRALNRSFKTQVPKEIYDALVAGTTPTKITTPK